MLHTTSLTTSVDVNDKNIAGIVQKEIKLLDIKLATLEGTAGRNYPLICYLLQLRTHEPNVLHSLR